MAFGSSEVQPSLLGLQRSQLGAYIAPWPAHSVLGIHEAASQQQQLCSGSVSSFSSLMQWGVSILQQFSSSEFVHQPRQLQWCGTVTVVTTVAVVAAVAMVDAHPSNRLVDAPRRETHHQRNMVPSQRAFSGLCVQTDRGSLQHITAINRVVLDGVESRYQIAESALSYLRPATTKSI